MISVIIPTHKRDDLLIRAITSVSNQTYKDIEIIVVSDGFSESTENLVKSLQKDDNRIQFYSYECAKGANFARNYGIDKANGEFIAFLDDDDEWLPNKIEKQYEIMKSHPEVGLVYTGVHIIYVNENVEYNASPSKEGDLKNEILLDNCIGTTSTVMVRKGILDEVGGFDEKLPALQDFDLWIRICQVAEVRLVKEELINYYNYRGTVQISSFTSKYEDAFKYIDEKYKDKIDCLTEEEKKRKEINKYYLLVNKALRNNDAHVARRYIKEYMKVKWDKKMCVFYFMSFIDYKYVLKLRSIM